MTMRDTHTAAHMAADAFTECLSRYTHAKEHHAAGLALQLKGEAVDQVELRRAQDAVPLARAKLDQAYAELRSVMDRI